RAGALNRVARTLQVQLVRHPGRQRVAGVAHQELQRIEPADERRVGRQVEQEIGAQGGAGEDPDLPVAALRVVAGVLQRLPRRLQEQALLRIEDLRLAVVDTEEGGVELVDV